jgi:hypothetical protein
MSKPSALRMPGISSVGTSLAAVIWWLAIIGNVLVFTGAFESRNTKRANTEISQALYDPYGPKFKDVTGAAMVCGFVNAEKKLGCHRQLGPTVKGSSVITINK